MLRVYRSNREDLLAETLAGILASPVQRPTEAEWLSVQSGPMGAWLRQKLSRRLGIWAGAKFLFPGELMNALFSRVLGDHAENGNPFQEDILTFSIFSLLPKLVGRPEFSVPKSYLKNEGRGLRRFRFSQKIARIFDAYSVYRPDMLLGWEVSSADDDWQAVLFRALLSNLGPLHMARRAEKFLQAINGGSFSTAQLPARVSLVCISHLPPLFLQILDALGNHIDVHLFISCPSKEYFGHIGSGRPGMGNLKTLPEESGADDGNPLLVSLGRLGRDFQQTIEELCTYHESEESLFRDPGATSNSTLLKMVQSDIFNMRDGHGEETARDNSFPLIDRNDFSIAIHSSPSPLRELEVLRNSLLALFDDKSLALAPEDVLIMTPDIHVYFPYIESVFAGETDGPPPIPYGVCDLRPREDSQVIGAFFKILELGESRVTIEDVFDILRIPPVRDKADFTEEEINIAYNWSLSSGIRWGIDGHHREQHGQPAYEENTWHFGLQRMLLGYAMPEDNLDLFAGVLPFDPIEGNKRDILGKLAAFLHTLFLWQRTLQESFTLLTWSAKLGEMVRDTIALSGENLSDHQAIRTALDLFPSIATASKVDEKLHLKVIRDFLASKFESSPILRGFLSGGVTFSSLRPMRNVPFKVICLLGMNRQHFPRNTRAPEFDHIAKKTRIGDRSANLDDRYLFLQALLSARERFIITFVGQNKKDGSPQEPSQVVHELLDTIEAGFRLDNQPHEHQIPMGQTDTIRDWLITEHPRSPFSPTYFGAGSDPRLFSYSSYDCEGAVAVSRESRPIDPYLKEPIPVDPADIPNVSLDDLILFYKLPGRYLARHRLGLHLHLDASHASNREPIEPDPLDKYATGSKLLEERLQRENTEKLYTYFRARGILPLGQVGRAHFQELAEQVDALARTVLEHTGDARPRAFDTQITVDTKVGPTRIHGRIRNLWPAGRIEFQYGKITASSLLGLWIRHLFMLAPNQEGKPGRSTLVGRGENAPKVASFRPIDENQLFHFRDLVDIFWQGQTRPLPFFPESSLAYAQSICQETETPDIRRAHRKALGTWKTSWDHLDPASRLFYRHRDPIESDRSSENMDWGFSSLAVRIFRPLLAFLEMP